MAFRVIRSSCCCDGGLDSVFIHGQAVHEVVAPRGGGVVVLLPLVTEGCEGEYAFRKGMRALATHSHHAFFELPTLLLVARFPVRLLALATAVHKSAAPAANGRLNGLRPANRAAADVRWVANRHGCSRLATRGPRGGAEVAGVRRIDGILSWHNDELLECFVGDSQGNDGAAQVRRGG